MTRRSVLVLGWDDRSFLATVRSLGRRGVDVHVGWCPPDAPARRSRYIAAIHDLPPYDPAAGTWQDALLAVCRREQVDLVLPTNDQTLLPLQLHRAELERHVRLAILDDDTFRIASDKVRTHALARRLGIPVPRQQVLRLPASPDAVLDGFALPVVLKPRTSYRPEDLHRRRAVRMARDRATLAAHLTALGAEDELIVQECVPGDGAGVELLADDGTLLLACHQRRVHERRNGTNTYRVTAALPPDLRAAAASLVGALRYTGVAQLEVRIDPHTGAWFFLEMNARFWGALPLTIAAGADVPYYLYRLLVEGRRDVPQEYRPGVYGRNWRLDAAWWRERRGEKDRPPVRELLREAGRVVALREHNDTLVWDDPWPGLVEVGCLVRRLGGRSLRPFRREAPPVLPGCAAAGAR